MDRKATRKANAQSTIPVAMQVSAGGVAVRQSGATTEVAIVLTNPSRRWQLPKGIVDEGESLAAAAVREVREEAGIDTEVLAPVETVEYWYVGNHGGVKTRFHKFVHFFLLAYRGGHIAVDRNSLHEVAEAHWVSAEDAVQMLAFKSEQGVVENALHLLDRLPD